MEIKITKGLQLPIVESPLQKAKSIAKKITVAADLSFADLALRVLVQVGEDVKIGKALVQDKMMATRIFPSPGGGKVVAIQRGLKRKLLRILIEIDDKEEALLWPPIDMQSASREQILERMLLLGGFFRVHSRPFDALANPEKLPSHIFVKCLESAPLSLPLSVQLQGNEELFSIGLESLKKLCPNVHLVCDTNALTNYKANIVIMKGKYPKSSLSLAIDKIAPITHLEDIIWTLNLYDMICIGSMMQGKLFTEKKVGLFQFENNSPSLFLARDGVSFSALDTPVSENERILSSHPLVGNEVGADGYLGFHDFQFTRLNHDDSRPALHFLRMNSDHFASSRIYGFSKKHFSTNLNGEGGGARFYRWFYLSKSNAPRYSCNAFNPSLDGK